MAVKKMLTMKEIEKKIKDLKIELLKSPTKKGRVKKEIARLLTMAKIVNSGKSDVDGKADKTKDKSVGGKA